MPRELAGLVHRESVVVLDTVRRRVLAEGENVVLEGTLGWPPQDPRLLQEFLAAGYERVDILDVQVPPPVEVERVTGRWWVERFAAVVGTHPLGAGSPSGGRGRQVRAGRWKSLLGQCPRRLRIACSRRVRSCRPGGPSWSGP